ncbi:MAG: phosphoglycerate kinase [Bacteroidales bacterium]|nr:phosphoglycerate kinase [Bacteroidales bacterium]
MKTVDDYNFKNERALIRADFNVPLDDQYTITDTNRIDATIPTIQKILNDGGAVILMSHLGRPKGERTEKYSLKHLVPFLSESLGCNVKFADDCIGEETKEKAQSLKPGEVLLLENLRFHKEETKGDEEFAKQLAELADVYVNDAFGTAHREHASTAVIARFFPGKKMFGYILGNEIKYIDKVMHDAKKPYTAILGGAKVSGKIEVINNLLDKVDNLLIGGGMMFTFIKALGGKVGNSLVENDLIDVAKKTMERAEMLGVKLFIPVDAIIADKFADDADKKTSDVKNIPDDWMGMDIGPETLKQYNEIIKDSKTLLWNGPMGVFEMASFAEGTQQIAKAVADATSKGAFSVIGGGDSVAAINKYHLGDKVSFVSTGGGAMLEFIEGKELPGIKAINE